MKKNKKWIFLLFGIAEAIIAVICFSRGILNLMSFDGSIVKAIIAIGIVVILIAGFVCMSIWYLHEPKVAMMDENASYSNNELISVLDEYTGGKYFGPIARTVKEQLSRLNRSCERSKAAIVKKFDVQSMSYEKYYSIVDAAEKTANQNVVAMTNRMKFFDEDEYARLENYRNDNIPDDIQERQIALYKENHKITSCCILVLYLAMGWKWDILTSIPRNLTGGFPFAVMGIYLLVNQKKQNVFVGTLFTCLGAIITNNAAIISIMGFLYYFLSIRFDRKNIMKFSGGIVVACLIYVLIKNFYIVNSDFSLEIFNRCVVE